jgi:hypothetical protein
MSGVRFLWAVPVHDNLLLALTKSKQALTPEKSLDNQRQTEWPHSSSHATTLE